MFPNNNPFDNFSNPLYDMMSDKHICSQIPSIIKDDLKGINVFTKSNISNAEHLFGFHIFNNPSFNNSNYDPSVISSSDYNNQFVDSIWNFFVKKIYDLAFDPFRQSITPDFFYAIHDALKIYFPNFPLRYNYIPN